MEIVRDFPPNFDEIDAAFGVRGNRSVIFCYGPRIYNPHGNHIPEFLIAHELVHSRRQGDDPAGWWRRYIDDTAFRFAEELYAHRAEYASRCRGTIRSDGSAAPVSRPQRRIALKDTAKRLSGPLYGRMLSFERCRTLIQVEDIGDVLGELRGEAA